MKAISYDRYGSPNVLKLIDLPMPVPTAGEVLIKVHATSVNSWDWDLLTGSILGRLGAPLRPGIKVLGADLSGVVEAIGPGVSRFKVGEAVFGDVSECGWGGFAEYVTAAAGYFARKPDGLGFVEAAAMPQAGLLALQAMRHRPLRAGDKVLINGAGGGVGSFAIPLAKRAGAEVTGVDTGEKLDFMRSLGADHVIDYGQQDFARGAVGYDLIVDNVATRSPFAIAGVLRAGGVYAMVGGRPGALLSCAALGPLIGNQQGKKLGLVMFRPNAEDLIEMADLVITGALTPVIDRTYSLEETAEALRHVGEGRSKGKVVINLTR